MNGCGRIESEGKKQIKTQKRIEQKKQKRSGLGSNKQRNCASNQELKSMVPLTHNASPMYKQETPRK